MTLRCWVITALLLSCAAAPARAQDAHVHDAPPGPWQWGVDGTAFGGYNYQLREFTNLRRTSGQAQDEERQDDAGRGHDGERCQDSLIMLNI